jgi:hypothetical protein
MREIQRDRLTKLRDVSDERQVGNKLEKLSYSRRNAAEDLSLSVRSIDCVIAMSRRPSSRRIGGKVLIRASVLRRFARQDHFEQKTDHLTVVSAM